MIDILSEVKKKLPPEHVDHWQSDLYIKATPEAAAIIANYEYKNLVTTFIDNIDHVLWYEIPFAYYETK